MEASPYHFLPTVHAGRGNVTTFVTDALRHAIVTLEMKPGETIDKGALCTQLGVSRFPVSEALARLQAEGLVDIQPQRGSTVSLVRIVDVLEYMLIRKALEAEAVRVVTAAHGPDFTSRLAENLAAQRAAAARDDRRKFHDLDVTFHELVFEEVHFDRLRSVIDNTRANLDRARRLILTPRRLEETLAEHLAILDGVRSGDPHTAAAAMRAHIDAVMAELITFATGHPELFADGDRLRDEPAYARFPFG